MSKNHTRMKGYLGVLLMYLECCAFFSGLRRSHLYKLNKLSSALQNEVLTIPFQPIQRVLIKGYLKYVMRSFAFYSVDGEICSHLSCRGFSEASSIVGRVAHEAEVTSRTACTRWRRNTGTGIQGSSEE